jgi:excisionase family DNA binding protein
MATTPRDEYLLVPEVMAITRSPKGTVRHWLRTGRLPSIKPGRHRLIRREDLERFLCAAAVRASDRKG